MWATPRATLRPPRQPASRSSRSATVPGARTGCAPCATSRRSWSACDSAIGRDERAPPVLGATAMIDFGLSDEQEALQRSAREFLARECPPALVRETARSDDGVPRDLYRKMAELGWMGLIVPEKENGLGLGALDLVLVLEELGRVAAPGPFLATQLLMAALVGAGTAAQRGAWLPRILGGEVFGSLAHLEETDRHEPGGIQARAKKTRDGYVLSGTKLFVPEAQAADVFLVAARTKAGSGAAGVS